MPEVEGECFKMKLNGYDDVKQPTNGTNDAQNFFSEILVCDDMPECSLCKQTFTSIKDFETHSISLEHAEKVLAKNSLISVSSNACNNTVTSQSEKMCIDKIDKQEQQEKNPCSIETDDVLLHNKAKKLPESPYSCSFCIKEFTGPEPYRQHLESKSHKKRVLLEKNSFAEIKRIEGYVFCDVCNKECSGEKPYQEHLVSKEHKMMEQRLQFLKENTEDDSDPTVKKIKLECISVKDKQLFCETCKIPCSGLASYNQHLAGNTHKRNMARSKQLGVKNVPSISQLHSLQDNDEPAFTKSIKHSLSFVKECTDEDSAPKAKKVKMEPTYEEKQWFCEICMVECNGPLPFSQHVTGITHKRKEARSQRVVKMQPSINLLDQPTNSSLYHASPSLEKIKAEKEENKAEIDSSKPAWFCKICNIQTSGPFNYAQHLVGKSHTKKVALYHKSIDFKKTKDSIDFYGTETNVNNLAEEINCCTQEQNVYSENVDYERELKKSVVIFSPDKEINLD